MAPNSRPPLTSRIRASFDGKRTKSQSGRVMSPTDANSFGTQDSDSLRTAIDEAINSEIFQKAIAANLAKLIKPSIKSALDTIQPVVEAVYSHELLLRKTNRSVEDILIRLDEKAERRESIATHRESVIEPWGPEPNDGVSTELADEQRRKVPPEDVSVTRERAVSSASVGDLAQHRQLLLDNHTKTTSALTQLSISVKASNGKIAEALQGISDVDTKLRWSSESIESLKSTSEQSNTTIAVLQAQLDRLKKDMGQIMASIGPDLGKSVQALSQSSQSGAPDTSLFNSHTTKLDAISTDLAALKGHSDTVEKIDAVSTELASLKASVDAGITANSEGLTGLGSQISNVLTTLEGHTGTLGEIKDKGPHPEILAALQQSNDSHAAHAASLGEIKERAEAPTESIPSERGSPETTAALQDLKSDLASLWENIEAGLTSNNENVMSVGAKVDNVLATIEGHKASDPSADILAAVQASNDSHASHAAALEELKSREVAPAPALDNSELTTQINTLAETLNAHTATLDEIKAGAGAHAAGLEELMSREVAPAHVSESIDHTAQLNTIVETINANTATLDEIKAGTGAHAARLEELKTREVAPAVVPDNSELTTQINALTETLNSHTATLDEIKIGTGAHAASLEELKSREAAPATVSDSVDHTAQLNSIVETINAHTATLDEIKAAGGSYAAALESHGTALEGLRSINNVPESVAETETSNIAPLEAHMSSIVSILEEHSEVLNEIKSHTNAHTTALEGHGAALEDIKSLSKDTLPAVENPALESQVAALATTLESHTSALDEIKAHGSEHTIALEGHGSAIEGIKSLGVAPTPVAESVDISGLEGHINAIIATLESHTTALEGLKAASGAHATALEQSRSLGDALPAAEGGIATALEGQINAIVATLQAHSTALDEIRAANQSHTDILGEIDSRGQTHASTLDEIKATTNLHTSALEGIKSPGIPPMGSIDSASLASLEIQIGSIVKTLDAQTSALKQLNPQAVSESTEMARTASSGSDDALSDIMTTIVETLEIHTMLLNEMKEDVSAEILTTLHDLSQTQANQSSLLEEIREADLSDEVLTLLHASSESHANHSAALDKIDAAVQAANESHASHTASLDEIKSRSFDAAPTTASDTSPVVDFSGLEAKVDSMAVALEEHKTTLEEIKGMTSAANDLHANHTASLDELKSRSIEPVAIPATVDIGGVETKIDSIISALEDHKAALTEISDTTSVSHELHTSYGAALDEIKSRLVEPTTVAPVDLPSLDTQLGAITASLEEHKNALLEVKDLHTAHGAALDEIKSRPLELPPTPATDLSGLETQLSAITAALDEHKTTLAELKELHTVYGASLDEIKSLSADSAPAPTTDLSGLETQLIAITAVLDEHKVALAEVRATGLASHKLHTAYATSLDDIKARSIEPVATASTFDISSLETQMASINSSIDEIKAKSLEPAASAVPVDLSGLETQLAGLASMLEEHKATLSEVKATSLASHDLHTAQATSLDEIKSRSIKPSVAPAVVDLSGLETQLNTIAASLDEHKTILSILANTSSESHLSYTAALIELKDAALTNVESHSSHAAALSDIKDATSSWNEAHSANAFTLAEIRDAAFASNESHLSHAVALSELKDATAKANEAHASHTAAFADLKSVQPVEVAPVSEEVIDLSPIEGHLATIIGTLEGQTATLAEIKEASSQASPELLASVKVSHDLLTSHTALLDAIKDASSHEDTLTNITELKSIISDSHAEHSTLFKDLHTEIKDSHSSLDSAKEKIDSVAAQIDINHTTVTTSITTLSDELKAEVDATGTHVSDQIINLSSNLGSVNLAVAGCTQSSKSVEGKLENLESSIKQTGSFVVGLYEGVHLNDTGVGQLQEQLVTWVIKGRGTGFQTPVESLPVEGTNVVVEDGEKGKGLEPPIAEGAWFKKKETRRAVSPSPLREVETVSPPAELQGPLVEEGEEMEEEMPSIDAVLKKEVAPETTELAGKSHSHLAEGIGAAVLGGAAVASAAAWLSYDDEDNVKEADDSTNAPAVQSETPPSDESKEIEEPEPAEPDAAIEETSAPQEEPVAKSQESKEIEEPHETVAEQLAIPDPLVKSIPVETEISPDESNQIEKPMLTEPEAAIEETAIAEPLEESPAVEAEITEAQASEKPKEVIAETPAVDESLEESPAVESSEDIKEVEKPIAEAPTEETAIPKTLEEPVAVESIEEAKEIEEHPVTAFEIPAEDDAIPEPLEESIPVESTEELITTEPEAGAGETAAPEILEESPIIEDEMPQESKDIEENIPAEIEESSQPAIEEEASAVESESIEAKDEPAEEAIVPDQADDLAVEVATIEESKDIDELTPIEHEPAVDENSIPEPVEESHALETETAEESTPIEAHEPTEHAEKPEEAIHDDAAPEKPEESAHADSQKSIDEAKDTDDSPAAGPEIPAEEATIEEPAEHAKEIEESPAVEAELLTEDTLAEEPTLSLETAVEEPIIGHEAIPADDVQEDQEPATTEPEASSEGKEIVNEDSPALEVAPSVDTEGIHEPPSDEINEEVHEPESEPISHFPEEESAPESLPTDEVSREEPTVVEDDQPKENESAANDIEPEAHKPEIEPITETVEEQPAIECEPIEQESHSESVVADALQPSQPSEPVPDEFKNGSVEPANESIVESGKDADAPESELVQEDEVHPESDAIVAEEDLPKVEESAPAVEDVHDEPSPEIEYPADHARDEATPESEDAKNEVIEAEPTPEAHESAIEATESDAISAANKEVPASSPPELEAESGTPEHIKDVESHEVEPETESTPEPQVIDDEKEDDHAESHDITTTEHEPMEPESETVVNSQEIAKEPPEVHDAAETRDEDAREVHEATPTESTVYAVEHPSEEMTELGQESPRDPEPTPVELTDDEYSTIVDDSHPTEYVPESMQATTAATSEAGGALIEDLKDVDDSRLAESTHEDLPSSPFIKELESKYPTAHFEAENSHEDEPAALEFGEPHPSPISEYHPSSLIHEPTAEDDDSDSPEEHEGIPIRSHEHVSPPLDGPIQSHSVPCSGLHADSTPFEEIDEPIFTHAGSTGLHQAVHQDDTYGHEAEADDWHLTAAHHEPAQAAFENGDEEDAGTPLTAVRHEFTHTLPHWSGEEEPLTPSPLAAHAIAHHEEDELEETEHQQSHAIPHHDEDDDESVTPQHDPSHSASPSEDGSEEEEAHHEPSQAISHPEANSEDEKVESSPVLSHPSAHSALHEDSDEDDVTPVTKHNSHYDENEENDEPHDSPAFSGGFA